MFLQRFGEVLFEFGCSGLGIGHIVNSVFQVLMNLPSAYLQPDAIGSTLLLGMRAFGFGILFSCSVFAQFDQRRVHPPIDGLALMI